MLNRELLLEISERTGFQEDTLEKVFRIKELLRDISHHPFLKDVLVLKGGTALNLFFGSPHRLSVDLDFNYVGELELSEMKRERPRIERAIQEVTFGLGYHVDWSREAYAGRKCYLSFVNVSKSRARVEIDLNYLHRVPLLSPEKSVIWNPERAEEVVCSIVSFEELSAGKICAMFDRVAPRDLYDVMRLPVLAGDQWQSSTLRTLIIAMSGILPRPVYCYDENRMARVTDEMVERQLHPMLVRTDKPNAAELRKKAWECVVGFIELSANERSYLDRLQEGELLPELLFSEDTEIVDRLRKHPALLWKAENALRYTKKKSGGKPPT